MNTPPEMSFLEHLGELRKRLIVSTIAVLLGACLTFAYSREIFEILAQPYVNSFPNSSLIGTGPAEAFMLRLQVAFFAGLLLVLPVIFYQVWLFVAPGLHEHEKRIALPFVLCTTGLFIGGVYFCYDVIFPFAFDFFHDQYVLTGLSPTIRMSEHLSVVVKGLLGFGIAFEMPVLAFFLGRLGVLSSGMMKSGLRYAVVIIFIAAGVLTPPDVLTQFLMAAPLLILYGVSYLIVRWVEPKSEP